MWVQNQWIEWKREMPWADISTQMRTCQFSSELLLAGRTFNELRTSTIVFFYKEKANNNFGCCSFAPNFLSPNKT